MPWIILWAFQTFLKGRGLIPSHESCLSIGDFVACSKILDKLVLCTEREVGRTLLFVYCTINHIDALSQCPVLNLIGMSIKRTLLVANNILAAINILTSHAINLFLSLT